MAGGGGAFPAPAHVALAARRVLPALRDFRFSDAWLRLLRPVRARAGHTSKNGAGGEYLPTRSRGGVKMAEWCRMTFRAVEPDLRGNLPSCRAGVEDSGGGGGGVIRASPLSTGARVCRSRQHAIDRPSHLALCPRQNARLRKRLFLTPEISSSNNDITISACSKRP